MALTQQFIPEPDIAQLSDAEFDAYLGWLSREVYRCEPAAKLTFPADFEPPF